MFRVKWVLDRWLPHRLSKCHTQTTVLSEDANQPDDLLQLSYVTPGFNPFSHLVVSMMAMTIITIITIIIIIIIIISLIQSSIY